MNLAKVTGSLWSTRKDPSFNGMQFCVIQPIDQHEQPYGEPLIAVDPENKSGRGEMVFYVDGGDATTVRKGHNMPSDATIVGIVDTLYTKPAGTA